jgi:hypothetical protein
MSADGANANLYANAVQLYCIVETVKNSVHLLPNNIGEHVTVNPLTS